MNLNEKYNNHDIAIEDLPKKRAIIYVSGGVAHEGPVNEEVEVIILDMDNAKEAYGGRDYHDVLCPKCHVLTHEVAWNAATAHDFQEYPERNMTPVHMVNTDTDPDMQFTCPCCFEVSEAQELEGAGRGE